jgi:hypothetical protein
VQGQYSDVCYDFRRGSDAKFRVVRAGLRPYECGTEMLPAMLCVRFRDDDCGRDRQQGQYNYDRYNLRRGSDAIFRAVRAGFMARECKVEMLPAMLCAISRCREWTI